MEQIYLILNDHSLASNIFTYYLIHLNGYNVSMLLWAPESQNSLSLFKASLVSPVGAVADQAKLEQLGKGVEVSKEVVRGDVDVVVEVGHCAVPHVPCHQDHLDREHHDMRKKDYYHPF